MLAVLSQHRVRYKHSPLVKALLLNFTPKLNEGWNYQKLFSTKLFLFLQVRMARLQSLEIDKKLALDGVTSAKAEEAVELTDFILVS